MRTVACGQLVRSLLCGTAVTAGLLAAAGCATVRATLGAYETGPRGIARPQQQLRDALARADYPSALAWHEDDALLRELGVGITSYYAAQFARSAAVLDSAALLADDRVTNSVSGNALALITNDLARPYQVRRTERLFIPYYGMLAYARQGQWEEAAVEARRLSALLAQFSEDRMDAERATHALLHCLAGAVFERARERNDARVAYRKARALFTPPAANVCDTSGTTEGDVLVVVERGFVAHRVTKSLNIMLGGAERDSLRTDDRESSTHAALRIAERVSLGVSGPNGSLTDEGLPRSPRRGKKRSGEDDEGPYWLSVAVSSLRRGDRVGGEATLLVDGAPVAAARLVSLLDDATAADGSRERNALLARAIARVAAKYALTKAVKDSQGELAGAAANAGASLLERADIRSWHLLPQEITLLRVHVPAGTHRLQVAPGSDAEPIELGPVIVRAGSVTIAAVRLWQEPPHETIASVRPAP